MKKSELKRIIKETIKEIQQSPQRITNEQVISAPSPGELLSDFAQWNQQNGSPLDWRCMPSIRSWLIGIFGNAPFQTSTNPLQPCTFIQNKINQIQTWVTNFSGNPNSTQLAMKQCKLQAFQVMLPWAQQQFNC